MDDAPLHSVRCLKGAGPSRVWLVERPGGARRVVKSWRLTPLLRLKMLVQRGQPQRQVQGTRAARAAGVAAPAVVGAVRRATRGGRRVVEIELEYAEGRPALDVLADDAVDLATKRAAARAAGALVAQLARARLFNRDLKLTNLIVDERSAGGPAVWMIDPVGMRRMRDRTRGTERMIERLGVQPIVWKVPLPSALVIAALRPALRGLRPAERRAVLRRLRSRRRR